MKDKIYLEMKEKICRSQAKNYGLTDEELDTLDYKISRRYNGGCYHLFNIKTKEHLKLCASHSQLTTIVVEILKGKQTIPTLNDDDFINNLITIN